MRAQIRPSHSGVKCVEHSACAPPAPHKMAASVPTHVVTGASASLPAAVPAAGAGGPASAALPGLQLLPSLVEYADDSDTEAGAAANEDEIIVEPPPPADAPAAPHAAESEADSDDSPSDSDTSSSASSDASSDSDDDDDGDDSEAAANGSAPSVGQPDSSPPAASSPATRVGMPALVEEEDLCVGVGAGEPAVSASAEGEELLEYEIVIDGEVVGTTFLPKQHGQGEEDAAAAIAGSQAAAEAIKEARRRKFEQRVGAAPGSTAPGAAAAAAAAASGPFVPQPPALCSSCHKENVKYRCPKCEAGTCCLACVNAHKASTGCSGKRSRSNYVPLARMNEDTLAADVRFLSDVERMAGSAARDQRMQDKKGRAISMDANQAPSAAATPVGDLFGCTGAHLDSRSFTLMAACQQQRMCKLMMMPQGMKMHTQNKSKLCTLRPGAAAPSRSSGAGRRAATGHPNLPDLSPAVSVIRWTVHLLFRARALTQSGPATDLRVVLHKMDERSTWAQVLDSVLMPPPPVPITYAESKTEEPAAPVAAARKEESTEVPAPKCISTALLRHQLAAFMPPTAHTHSSEASAAASSPAPYSHVALLLQVPFQPATSPLFHRVSPSSSILSSLQHQILIEHPVLYVVTLEDLHSYTLAPEPPAAPAMKKGGRKKQAAEGAAVSEGPPPPRKKRRALGEGDAQDAEATSGSNGAAAVAAAAAAASDMSDVPVAARPAPAAALAHLPRPPPAAAAASSSSSFRGGRGGGARHGGSWGEGESEQDGGGYRGRGGGGRGGWSDRGRGGRGRGRGGRGGRGGGAGSAERGRGGGSWGGGARDAFSFGVASAPVPPPPPPVPTPPQQPTVFKKWAA